MGLFGSRSVGLGGRSGWIEGACGFGGRQGVGCRGVLGGGGEGLREGLKNVEELVVGRELLAVLLFVLSLRFGIKIRGSWCLFSGVACRVQSSWFRVSGFGFRVSGFWIRFRGLWSRVQA